MKSIPDKGNISIRTPLTKNKRVESIQLYNLYLESKWLGWLLHRWNAAGLVQLKIKRCFALQASSLSSIIKHFCETKDHVRFLYTHEWKNRDNQKPEVWRNESAVMRFASSAIEKPHVHCASWQWSCALVAVRRVHEGSVISLTSLKQWRFFTIPFC